MGWSMRWATTLMGVHTIGKAHKENSGYNGSWVMPNSTGIFNNDYYRSMLHNGWGAQKVGPEKHQWHIISKDKPDGLDKVMMLNSDICLAYNDNKKSAACWRKSGFGLLRSTHYHCSKYQFSGRPDKGGRFLNAKNFVNKTCCAWFNSHAMNADGVGKHGMKTASLKEGQLYCGKPYKMPPKDNH